jgi:pyruvate-formate lyase-activating enzyme
VYWVSVVVLVKKWESASVKKCISCSTPEPKFAWLSEITGKWRIFCHSCTYKCQVCGNYAIIEYEIVHTFSRSHHAAVFTEATFRCDTHRINNPSDVKELQAWGTTEDDGRVKPKPDKCEVIGVKVIEKLATLEEFQVFMIMME